MTRLALDAALKRAERLVVRGRSKAIDVDRLSNRQLLEEYAGYMKELGAPGHLLPTESEYQDAFWALGKVFDRLNRWSIEHSKGDSEPSTRPATPGNREPDSH